jgi:hypothetical protein
MQNNLQDLHQQTYSQFFPNGDADIEAGKEETKRIFSPLLDDTKAHSIFLKTLLKLKLSPEYFTDDTGFQKALELSGLHNSTYSQRQEYITYFKTIFSAVSLGKSPKDIVRNSEGKYVLSDTGIFGNITLKKVIATAVIGLFGISGYNSMTAPNNNFTTSNNQVQSGGMFSDLIPDQEKKIII